jgi:hypothetical protein
MKEITGNLFPRRLDGPLPIVEKAQGVWIEDTDGHRYLDATGGAVVVNVGHGREEIAKAVYDQILRYDYIHPTVFSNRPAEALAGVLAGHAPKGLNRYYFLSGGAEAVETAIKMARQIHIDAGRPGRNRLISRWKSYHGLTLGALSASGRSVFRAPYAAMLPEVEHIPPPYCFRCPYGQTYPECGVRCALALEQTIQNMGPETISAFLAETVSGGSLAAYAPPAEYFTIIREICDHYNVLLILDEVMCGLGRTGRWFACQHYDVMPDIITLGKGLGGGVVPISAVGVRSEHFDKIRGGSGEFIHGGTFSHHAVAAAAGLATMRIIEKEDLVERVSRTGHVLEKKLKDALQDHPNVADVRGIGYLWGVEIVENKATNKPFARCEKVAERLLEAIFKKGVLVYKSTALAGTDGDAFLVAPPFIIETDEIDFIVDKIRKGIESVLGR